MTENKLDINPLALNAAQAFLQRWDADTLRLARIIEAALEKSVIQEENISPEQGQEAVQPCGHPRACIVSSDEGTHYCGWCEAYNSGYGDAVRELMEVRQKTDDELSQAGGWSWREGDTNEDDK